MSSAESLDIKKVLIPSQIGIGDTKMGMLGSGLKSRQYAKQPFTVVIDNKTYLVGPNVESYTQPLQRMDFSRLGNGAEAKALTFTSLGLALGPGHHSDIAVVVGFPVEVMKEEETAKAILRELKGWLAGEHSFTINKEEYTLDIDKVRVMAQPIGAYYVWSTNPNGKNKLPLDDINSHIVIVDIGFNTLDLYSLNNGVPVPRFTQGDSAGVRRAAEMLMAYVRREFKITYMSRLQANELLISPKPILESGGKSIDLTTIINQLLDASATQISEFCETHIQDGSQFAHILFTGGGSEMLRRRMLYHYPSAIVLPDAVMANAAGFAHAARTRWPDKKIVIGLDPGFGGFKVCVSIIRDTKK